MRNPEKIHVCHLRAADGGARLILQVELTGEGTVEKEVLTVFAARFDRPVTTGEITDKVYEEYRREAEFCEAVSIGMRSLGAGAESRAKLLQKLRVRGVTPDMAKEAVEELARRGFLDEITGAVREAERGLAKYWGNRRILMTLKTKGYPPAALRAAANRIEEEDSAKRLAVLLRRRHIPAPRDEKERQKLYSALIRYGYSDDEIRKVLRS